LILDTEYSILDLPCGILALRRDLLQRIPQGEDAEYWMMHVEED
jgi:hypothetical protein